MLGGSFFSMGKILAKQEKLFQNWSYEKLTSDEVRKRTWSLLCFITITDGNHSRGVAWTAVSIKTKIKVYMPKDLL